MSWSDGISYEIEFWDRFLEKKGDHWPDDYQKRLDPHRPVDASYIKLLDDMPANPLRVLDVGAGPMTMFGWTHPRKKIELAATDALAKEYDVLLMKYGITPPVRTMYAEAEKLTQHFASGMFDFVHAQNCLDHCAAPHVAVCQMLAVAKIGATVSLNHAENEGANENYAGFHQWDFTVEDGNFIMRGREQTINVTQLVSPVATIESRLENRWVSIRIKKVKDLTPDGRIPE